MNRNFPRPSIRADHADVAWQSLRPPPSLTVGDGRFGSNILEVEVRRHRQREPGLLPGGHEAVRGAGTVVVVAADVAAGIDAPAASHGGPWYVGRRKRAAAE